MAAVSSKEILGEEESSGIRRIISISLSEGGSTAAASPRQYHSFFSRASCPDMLALTAYRDLEIGNVSHVDSSSSNHGSSLGDEEEVSVEVNDPQILKPACTVTTSPAASVPDLGKLKISFNETEDAVKRRNSYKMFQTKSGRLLRCLHSLLSQPQEEKSRSKDNHTTANDSDVDPIDLPQLMHSTTSSDLPAKRYFAALKGPELEIVKDCEELLLPDDDKQWPFLLRIPIVCFGVSLGLGTQTILWKTLSLASSMQFLHIPLTINLVVWCLAAAILTLTLAIYGLKCLFYLEAVKREFYHPVRVNFFFAPWISCMFLTLGLPPAISKGPVRPILWCVCMAPILLLELKTYGQWLSGGERRLSKVANPSTHLSVVGNFVGALLAALLGWKELALFFWAVGVAHYFVLFVTLCQRLPTAAVLPKELHPVFFLFVAAPSTASVAWKAIISRFDLVSRIAFFFALFLYISLVVRINFFRGFTFSLSWWAYTFPMSVAAIASIHYSIEAENPMSQGLALLLSSISVIVVSAVLVLTLLHGLVWATLFPNDLVIAVASCKKKKKKDLHNRSAQTARLPET